MADSLPVKVVAKWKAELHSTDEENQKELTRRIARYEDAGHLRDPEVAKIAQDALIESHDENYQLIAWCIMPNHVHVLIRQNPDSSLGRIIQGWKGSSARRINLLLNRQDPLWEKDYFDRAIRGEDHYWKAIAYIHRNPVRAALVTEPTDWPYSSLGHNWPQ